MKRIMNDRADFDRMFREWYAQLFYFACQFIDRTEECRDIVNDAFEHLWRHFERIDQATAKTYLCAIIRNRCMDYLRRRYVHEDYVNFFTTMAREQLRDNAHETDERLMKIRKAMEKLTPYNRHILEECYLRKKKYQEVALELNVSVAAIHKNIVKALAVLRKELGQEGNRNGSINE